MTDRGIILAAAGGRYYTEAREAARQIERVWPEVSVTNFNFALDNRPVQKYRMEAMRATPYARTICMDTDTFVLEPVPELFDVLDQFDCALPMANIRHVYPIDPPECFYEFNPGVFAYRQSQRMMDFLIDWELRFDHHHDMLKGKSHKEIGWFHSQPSFTEAMYYSGLRIAPLGQEYNWQGSGYVQRKVKIVHKRPDPAGEAERINVAPDNPRTALLFGQVKVWT